MVKRSSANGKKFIYKRQEVRSFSLNSVELIFYTFPVETSPTHLTKEGQAQ